MSSVSLPVNRPAGRALIVGAAGNRSQALEVLQRLGFQCAEAEDPYAAVAELAAKPLVYGTLVLSLQYVFNEELQLIPVVKRRFPHVEVWLADLDGRQGALAEAMRLGADGLVGEDGLHRLAVSAPVPSAAAPVPDRHPSPPPPPARNAAPGNGRHETPSPAPAPGKAAQVKPSYAPPEAPAEVDDTFSGDAVLTADELRALLAEPATPPFE